MILNGVLKTRGTTYQLVKQVCGKEYNNQQSIYKAFSKNISPAINTQKTNATNSGGPMIDYNRK